MSSPAVNSLIQKLGKFDLHSTITTPPPETLIDRTHFSSSGGGYHSHSSHGSKSGHSIALSALTLLSFLFFLNILQNCLQEHMDEMNPTPQVIIMQARLKTPRENADDAAEKRKGELEVTTPTIFANVTEATFTSFDDDQQESRIYPESTTKRTADPFKRTKYQYQYDYDKYAQIPIKLKTVKTN